MKTIQDINNLEGKRVLVRADFNVPIEDGKVFDTYRLDKAIETIDLLRAQKAKIVLISHIESDLKTLWPVYDYLKGFFPVKFCNDFFTKEADLMVSELKDGEVLLFENLRNNEGEKNNDLEFAKKLANYGDVFINDAFSVSHRKHSSVVSVPKFLPTYFGPLFMQEYENLSKAFKPKHPFVFILGGAKFETKMPLIKKFLNIADNIFIVGALANDILKAKGFEVGRSLVGEGIDLTEFISNPKIHFPKDFVVLNKDDQKEERKLGEVKEGDYIADIGQQTLGEIKEICNQASFVLWNGPTGNYEIGFEENTEEVAKFLAQSGKEVILGGGDTVASIKKLDILDKFTFVSTAGGAMLDFLANETLPAIEA